MSTQTDIYKLYLSNFLTGLVFWYAIEQLFMLSIGLGTIGIGINIAVLAGFNLIFDIPSGMIADRWSRKRLLIVSAIALASASVVYGLSTSLTMYLVGTILYGIYIVSASGTYQALMYDTLHELGREKAYSKINGRAYGLFLVGAGIGNVVSGMIASHWSYKTAFFVTVISCMVNVLVMATMNEPRYHKDEDKERFLTQVGRGIGVIIRHKLLRVLVGMAAMLTVISVYFLDFGQLYVSQYVSDLKTIGALWALYAFALAAGSFVAHYFARHVWVAVLLASCPVISAFFVDHPLAIGFMFVQGIGANILINQIETRVQNHTISGIRATVLSIISALGRLIAIPVGITLGWMIDHQGVRPALIMPIIAAVLLLCLAMVIAGQLYKKKK